MSKRVLYGLRQVALAAGFSACVGYLSWYHGFYTGADTALCAVALAQGKPVTYVSCQRVKEGTSWQTR